MGKHILKVKNMSQTILTKNINSTFGVVIENLLIEKFLIQDFLGKNYCIYRPRQLTANSPWSLC